MASQHPHPSLQVQNWVWDPVQHCHVSSVSFNLAQFLAFFLCSTDIFEELGRFIFK